MTSGPGHNQGFAQQVRRLARRLPPRFTQAFDQRLENALERFDRLNRSLAERAIPRERRERVKQRRGPGGASRGARLRVVSRDSE